MQLVVFDVTKTEEYEDFFRKLEKKAPWIFWSIMRESILRRTILILRQRNLIRLWKRRQRPVYAVTDSGKIYERKKIRMYFADFFSGVHSWHA